MASKKVRRFGQIINLKPGCVEEYERYHSAVWPEVLSTIQSCNIRNYSIFRHKLTLFGYFEYVGDDFQADMAKMNDCQATQRWWAVMKPLQEPIEDCQSSDHWWLDIKEVFHTD